MLLSTEALCGPEQPESVGAVTVLVGADEVKDAVVVVVVFVQVVVAAAASVLAFEALLTSSPVTAAKAMTAIERTAIIIDRNLIIPIPHIVFLVSYGPLSPICPCAAE